MEKSIEGSQKMKIGLPYDPAIPLLGIYLKETKTLISKDTAIFTVALFMIAKTWKQPKYLQLTNGIRNSGLCIYIQWNITQP